jgi:hypothetical protein
MFHSLRQEPGGSGCRIGLKKLRAAPSGTALVRNPRQGLRLLLLVLRVLLFLALALLNRLGSRRFAELNDG